MKRERLITGEIDSQNNMTAVSISAMLASWKKGFEEVNEFFADLIEEPFSVDVNPAIAPNLINEIEKPADGGQPEPEQQQEQPAEVGQTEPEEPQEQQQEEPAEDAAAELEQQAEAVEAVADFLTDEEKPEGGESDEP